MLVKYTKPFEVNLSLSIVFSVLWWEIRPHVTFLLPVSRKYRDRQIDRRAREVYRDRQSDRKEIQ